MKVRCKLCQRRIKSSFSADACNRKDCVMKEKEHTEILTFKDWKDRPFKVIKDFECDIVEWDQSGWRNDWVGGY